MEFTTQIRRKLEQTDIFIVVFTGAEKESHSFTGMEVGYFMRVMEGRPGRMVPLFLSNPPATMSSVQGIGIGFDSKVLNLLPEAFDAQPFLDLLAAPKPHGYESPWGLEDR